MKSNSDSKGYSVGVDIGGTFTDCAVVSPAGEVRIGKVPTRPADRARSFFEAIEEAGAKFDFTIEQLLSRCDHLVHGTTAGTNALITRSGARVGLLVTAGHRDMPFIMKGAGRLAGLPPDRLLDLPYTNKPEPIVPRDRVREVMERIDFEGEIIVPLNETSLLNALSDLAREPMDALALSFLWSVHNHVHEQRAAEVARQRYPEFFVSCASAISSRVGEYERTMTGVINSYIGPLMTRYIRAIEEGAQSRGFTGRVLYAQCAGGAITAEEAQAAPIRTIQSGPVSGTMGSAFLAERMGEPNLIVTDMGGTSFDVSVIRNGSPELRETSFVERFEIALPMVHVDSIRAGGGSIAWIDDAGGLQVGPQSAGADPGPACYGKGGAEPTVTDADVVLGIIDPVNFLHGRLKLDLAVAESAIGRIAGRLHLDVYRAAAGINRIVDNKMADLLRRMSVMRGLDPRQFAYGGMGPVHSTAIARDVGVKRLIVPMLHAASVWSAFGATVSDVVHVYERWQRIPMPADTLQLDAVFEELESKGRETLLKEGYPRKRVAVQRSLRMKYAVQVFDLEVPVGNDLTKATSEFSRIYAERNGEVAGHPEGGVEITGFVVRVRGVREPLNMAIVPRAPSNWSSRHVYWEEFKEFVETPVLILNAGPVDERLKGPCLIQLPDTVVALRPGQSAKFDEFGSLIIDV